MGGWIRRGVATGLVTGAVLGAGFCTAAAAQAQESYQSMCDASAAASLGGGHFVAADDESDILKIYRRGASQPVGELRLARYLNSIDRKTTVAIAGESDIEGAAVVGDRIYWISSHGRKRDGSMDPQRWRFFATDIDRRAPTPSLMPAPGKPYKSLLVDMAADPRLAFLKIAAELRPEVLGGLSIDPIAREARVGGQAVELTPREFDLLYFFARQPGKVFSRLDLLNQDWGYQHDGYEHTVNTHINRLRTKIEKNPADPQRILTVWGRGYKLAEDAL